MQLSSEEELPQTSVKGRDGFIKFLLFAQSPHQTINRLYDYFIIIQRFTGIYIYIYIYTPMSGKNITSRICNA